MNSEIYKFQLSFRGQLVENSVDAFDVANTILATSQSLQEIAQIRYGDQANRVLKLNISAFRQGSLVNEFYYLVDSAVQAGPVLLPVIQDLARTGDEILSAYKTYLEIRKLLKGNRPEKIVPVDNNNVEIHINVNGDRNSINISYPDLQALQSKTLAKNTAKTAQILEKEDSLVEEISVSKKGENIAVMDKESAPYFKNSIETQILPQMKLKGVVTKIDSKVRSGYISVGKNRIPFTYSRDITQGQYELLVESLKKRIEVHLVGEVVMDYESRPQSLILGEVQSELRLFED